MSLSLAKTKRRIASVTSTKKISKAMELIATVKLKKYKFSLENNTSYADMIFDIVRNLIKYDNKHLINNVFPKNDKDKPSLYVVITSNLGLCSAYNSNIYKKVDETIDIRNDELIVFGQRGMSHFKNGGYLLNNSPFDANSNLNESFSIKLCNYLLKQYLENKYSTINLIYTHYVNSIRFIPMVFQILPLSFDENIEDDYKGYPPLIEPDIITVFKEIFPLYLSSVTYKKMLESQVSEQASRRTAMDVANDNADDLLNQLTREYNTSRQNAITREITEVVSAANAQK